MFRPAHNATDSPVLIDDRGRQLGGREWGPVDTTLDEVRAAEARRTLVVFDPAKIGPDAIDAARDAAKAADALNDRRGRLADVGGVAELRVIAERAGVATTVAVLDDDGRPAGERLRTHGELLADLVHHRASLDTLVDVEPATAEPDASPVDDASTPRKAAARKAAPSIPSTPEA